MNKTTQTALIWFAVGYGLCFFLGKRKSKPCGCEGSEEVEEITLEEGAKKKSNGIE